LGQFLYKIFGLKFISELEFPELNQEKFESPDIQIVTGRNPKHLATAGKKGILFEATNNDFLFRVDNTGSFRVQNGKLITIDPNPTSNIYDIRTFLFSSIMGALLHQREILPLHGCTININGEAISIIGNSSSGKSSLAAGFVKDGFEILSDDISAITGNGKPYFLIQPGLPYLRLWEDVLIYLKSNNDLQKVRPSINKYIKPLNQAHSVHPVPLRKIICLETMNREGFKHEIISGAGKLNLLKKHTYRYQYLNGAKQMHIHFNQIASLSNQIILYKVERQKSPLSISELVQYTKEQIIRI